MIVLKQAGFNEKNGESLWECQCDCGKIIVKAGGNLPKVKTCGNTCTALWDKTIPEHGGQGEPVGLIYKLTNLKDGKIYIGQTVHSLEDRWRRHIEYANRGGEGYLQKAIRTYGPDSFDRMTVTIAYNKQQLDELEKYYICSLDTFNPEVGYNQNWKPGPTDAARQTMSEKNAGELNPAYREDLLNEELIELYKSGVSLGEIARRYGTTHKTLSLRFKKLGIKITLQPNEKELNVDEIIERYKGGESLNVLAKVYDVSFWTIRDRLLKAGVELNKPSTGGFRKDVSTEELLAAYQSGIKISELSRQYKMDRKSIRARLKIGQENSK